MHFLLFKPFFSKINFCVKNVKNYFSPFPSQYTVKKTSDKMLLKRIKFKSRIEGENFAKSRF
jgi:hypothetical protein